MSPPVEETPNEAAAPEASPAQPAEPETPGAPPGQGPAPEPPPSTESAPPLTPDGAELTEVELDLSPSPEEPSEVEVMVMGARPERAPGSAHVITRDRLERFRRDDPNLVVLQAPGVYIRQEDGVGLRPNIGIRGANADRSKKITLMEDGVLFGPAPYSAPAAYYFPLMSRMVQVRVIKGPSAIGYGPQTVGGAIDFVTRLIPSEPSGAVDVSVGQYETLKTHAYFGASTDDVGFLFEGVRLHNGGFKELPDEADTGSTRSDWMVKGRYELDPTAVRRHRFDLKLGYSDEISNETYLGLTDEDFRRDPDRRYAASALDQLKSHRTSFVLTHRYDDDDSGLSIKTDAYRHEFARVWRKVNAFRGAALSGVLSDASDPANAEYYAVVTGQSNGATAADTLLIGPNDRGFESQGVQSVLSAGAVTGSLRHGIEVGARLHHDSIERRHSQVGFVMTDGLLVPEGSAEEVTAANRADSVAIALHASDAMNWHRLTLTPGVRTEFIASSFDDRLAGEETRRNVLAVMPGLGGYFAVTEPFGVLAGVYRGFSPPAPGSPDHVEPEYSVNTEVGVRYSEHPLRLELIGFYNDYQNLTDVCTLSSGCLTDNLDRQFDAGQATIYGLEAHAAHDLELGRFTLPMTASYTLTRGEFDTTFQSQDPIYGSVEAGDEIPYIPRHQVVASLGVEHALAGVVAAASYVSPMREAAGSAPLDSVMATDEQFWLDLAAYYHATSRLRLYANVNNVTDSRNIVARRPYGARPNAPRWVQVGARFEF